MAAAPEPRIAIVGGAETLVAEALAWMLTKGGCRMVGIYPSWRELLAAMRASKLRAQAAIVYADDPATGPDTVAEIKLVHPELKILLLCELATPALVRCAIEERVEGVVLTSDTAEETILALRNVLEGRAVMPAGWHAISTQGSDPLATLSAREREILSLLSCGMSNKQIAAQLTISSNTVKFHLRTIYSKLGVRNRVQATHTVGEQTPAPAPDAEHRDTVV
ncbi:MAG TPA: response regulator transcription factor [Solirubrobacteraceae bacterium]|nr:response regulator transcription factor [Solirubrobacteraceae bacterium]